MTNIKQVTVTMPLDELTQHGYESVEDAQIYVDSVVASPPKSYSQNRSAVEYETVYSSDGCNGQIANLKVIAAEPELVVPIGHEIDLVWEYPTLSTTFLGGVRIPQELATTQAGYAAGKREATAKSQKRAKSAQSAAATTNKKALIEALDAATKTESKNTASK